MSGRHTVLLALAPISIACSDVGPAPPPEHSAQRLWIYATGLSLASGDTVRMGVTAADSAVTTYVQFPDHIGNPWPDSLHIRWWISDTARATVNASGLILARTPGRTTMWVAVGATVDSGTLIVEPASGGSGFLAQSLSAGLLQTCGLGTTGIAYCWGSDFSGALGRGQLRQFNSAATPVAVSGGGTFTALTLGADFACALTATGSTYCWGGNQYGELGDGTDDRSFSEIGGFGRAVPVSVLGGHAFTSVRAGGFHVCALDAAGHAFCWGWHGFGQLGVGAYDGPGGHRSEPTQAGGDLRFQSLGAGRPALLRHRHRQSDLLLGAQRPGTVGDRPRRFPRAVRGSVGVRHDADRSRQRVPVRSRHRGSHTHVRTDVQRDGLLLGERITRAPTRGWARIHDTRGGNAPHLRTYCRRHGVLLGGK